MNIAPDNVDQTALEQICLAHRVRRLALFGSVARDEAKSDSDVDLLVEFEPTFAPSLFSLGGLAEDLRQIFDGRDIDLVIPRDLHWFIRDEVLRSARPLYEG